MRLDVSLLASATGREPQPLFDALAVIERAWGRGPAGVLAALVDAGCDLDGQAMQLMRRHLGEAVEAGDEAARDADEAGRDAERLQVRSDALIAYHRWATGRGESV